MIRLFLEVMNYIFFLILQIYIVIYIVYTITDDKFERIELIYIIEKIENKLNNNL